MAGEAVHDAHSVAATLQPAIALLGLGIGAALASRALRLNPIVGYIGLGLAITALGFGEAVSGPLVAAMAEAGVMFLLFNLGLHFSIGRIRAEAANIFGFGALQMLVTGGAFAGLFVAFGLPPAFAVLGGFALGLSSTAVVIGLVRERDQENCPVGRAAQSILVFQDIAAILLLVSAGALAAQGAILPALGLAGAKALAAFFAALAFARFATGPLFRLIGRAGSSEVYTATALFLALAAGWMTASAGLSLTLGAFLGGMAVADSRYRMMVQTEIDAFRGLFLSFFFISVGLSIDPAIVASDWPLILAAAAGLIALKCALNVIAALINRWSVPGSVQLGFLLGQGSEFALVLFALPGVAGLVEGRLIAILVSAIAISLALTPFLSDAGRKLAGKLRQGPPDEKLAGDDAPVVIVGLSAAGRAVADALSHSEIEYLAVEPDHQSFERALADGYVVHHVQAGDPRSWTSMHLSERQVLVVATGNIEAVRALRPLMLDRLPDLKTFVAVGSMAESESLSDIGVEPIVANSETGSERLIAQVFEKLGAKRRIPLPGRARTATEENEVRQAA
ncbi:MAG: cation:proton antiporter [Erythrobacter sp.]|jgi:CPA2 family monovalent cation:H+ antiporter-2|nr:cation:proton antiporter [Erythrobacter sp.]